MNGRECSLFVAGACLGALVIFAAPAPTEVQFWTARVALIARVEPVAVPDAEPMPKVVEYPDTVAYCLARPGLAESAHPCKDEGGDIEL